LSRITPLLAREIQVLAEHVQQRPAGVLDVTDGKLADHAIVAGALNNEVVNLAIQIVGRGGNVVIVASAKMTKSPSPPVR
jgi:threonine dehydrogenase-like Zn-dependent dehydrogenase